MTLEIDIKQVHSFEEATQEVLSVVKPLLPESDFRELCRVIADLGQDEILRKQMRVRPHPQGVHTYSRLKGPP